MSARAKARKRALDLIYAAEMRGRSPLEELQAHREDSELPLNDYTVTLVEGVAAHLTRLDEVIVSFAQDWTLARMPAVDRNVLRLAIFEVLFAGSQVPEAVAVSEALRLVRELSTDDSPAFVHGILGNVVRRRTELLAAEQTR